MKKYVMHIVVALTCMSAYALLNDSSSAETGTVSDDHGDCGSNAEYDFVASTGTLTVSGSGSMSKYNTYNPAPWDSYRSEIKTVVITGVSSIGSSSFIGCHSLETVTVSDSVTSIGQTAFAHCTSLRSVTFGTSPALQTIDNAAFENCTALTAFTIPDSVTTIANFAFRGCESLPSVSISENVTSLGDDSFSLCSSIGEFVVDGDNPKYCAVNKVLFSKDKTTLIMYPANMKGTEYTVPADVTTITANAFVGCSNLTSIKVADGCSYYSDENGILYRNSSMKELTAYPAGKTDSVYVMPDTVSSFGTYYMFRGCVSLTEIDLSDKITYNFPYFLGSAPSLTKVTINESRTDYKSVDGVVFNESGTTLLFYPAAKTGDYSVPEGTDTIDEYAFAYADKVTSIVIPDSVTTISYYVFYGKTDTVNNYGNGSLCYISFGDGLDYVDSDAFQNIVFTADGSKLEPTAENLKEKTFSVCAGTLDSGYDHGHTYVAHDATAATREKAGNALYYTCQYCDKVFKADKTTETAVEDETVFLVVFKNGTDEKEAQVPTGTAPAYSYDEPTKESTAKYTYTFKGWSVNGTDVVDLDTYKVTENDVEFEALFDETVNKYTVTFDVDGTKTSAEYDYGTPAEDIAIPENPAKAADAQYTYTFLGWDNEITEVTKNVTYTAVFDKTVREYEVVFKNGDTVLQDSKFAYGATPVYSKAVPTKDATSDYTYSFKGWSVDGSDIVDLSKATVTGDVTYLALFDSTAVPKDEDSVSTTSIIAIVICEIILLIGVLAVKRYLSH